MAVILLDSIKGLNFPWMSHGEEVVISGDDFFPEIIVLWNIILSLVKENRFPFKILGCPITKILFEVH